jgi:hypothetical protein
LIHAAGESAALFGPLPANTHAVALSASSEEDLLKLELRAQQRGIPHCSIREPDLPFNGALMAIGFLPGPKSNFKSLLGRYPLLTCGKTQGGSS